MKTLVVVTPANIEITYRLAGAGSRLAAFVIDLLLQGVLGAVLTIAALYTALAPGAPLSLYQDGMAQGFLLGGLIIALFVIFFLYFFVCEMLMNGQSVGKKLFGLRVICDNGQPVGAVQSLTRNLFRAVLDIMYVGLFCILFSKKHKRIGDMVAGTVVVAEHYGGEATLTPPLRPEATSFHTEPQRTLDESERDLLARYVARRDSLPDGGAKLQKQWAAYLARKWQLPPAQFDGATLAGLSQAHEAAY